MFRESSKKLLKLFPFVKMVATDEDYPCIIKTKNNKLVFLFMQESEETCLLALCKVYLVRLGIQECGQVIGYAVALTLLCSERPKLFTILAFLSLIGLTEETCRHMNYLHYNCPEKQQILIAVFGLEDADRIANRNINLHSVSISSETDFLML